MTKREICSRLFGVIGLIDNSHDELLRAGINIVMPYTMAKEMLQNLVLDIASSEELEDFQNPPKMNPCDGSPDDIVPDGNGGWRRRGDENITYTYGTGTNEAGK